MDISSIINELGEEREAYFNSVAPPIIQTSNFAFKSVAELRRAFENEYGSWLYSRGINPTVKILCKKLAALDGAEDCLVFNSGAAAIFAAVLSQVKTGDHIVSVQGVYTWAKKMFDEILPRFGVDVSYVDGTEINNFKAATNHRTGLYYLESPNSWTFEIQDLEAVARLAKTHHITTICDNSYCTPLYQRPVDFGIDLVLQSATKYISGHSDVIAGVLTGSSEKISAIFNSEYLNIGSGIQPFNAWLLLRGLRTLPARLHQIADTSKIVIDWLKKQPCVETVLFPLDTDFPQFELATSQMSGAGGLLTFVLKKCTLYQIESFCNQLEHILIAVSWGGHESLIIPRCASISSTEFDPANRAHLMLRLYVGLESANYIISDIDQAFRKSGLL